MLFLASLVVVYSFSEIKSSFLIPFLKLRGRLLMVRGMVSICLIRKDKQDLFLHKGLLFDWFIFLLYLLQSVCCSV